MKSLLEYHYSSRTDIRSYLRLIKKVKIMMKVLFNKEQRCLMNLMKDSSVIEEKHYNRNASKMVFNSFKSTGGSKEEIDMRIKGLLEYDIKEIMQQVV